MTPAHCTRHPERKAIAVVEEVAPEEVDRYVVGQRLCAACMQEFNRAR